MPGPGRLVGEATNLVVARVGRRDLVRVALPRGVRRISRGHLSRREVGAAGSDPLLELHDVETDVLPGLILLILHIDLLLEPCGLSNVSLPMRRLRAARR